ncbi:hypothetical protein [Gracilimonas tropica]|uniref:hypothetical protein n=1 Tax=Gracilimonas tropica TaxID=454600 RepID=UPI000371316F|nr:hypothetical protein [Gracilimonas tropica]
MKAETVNMLHPDFYKMIMQSFLENPLLKAVIAAVIALFTVPIEFVVALPIFWILDFVSGLYAAKKKGSSFSVDKLNSQYVKIGIHIAFLIGMVVLANLFAVQKFIVFGFGYIISTEFISTIRNLFGDKKSVQIISHFKELFEKTIGLDLPDPDPNDSENEH